MREDIVKLVEGQVFIHCCTCFVTKFRCSVEHLYRQKSRVLPCLCSNQRTSSDLLKYSPLGYFCCLLPFPPLPHIDQPQGVFTSR